MLISVDLVRIGTVTYAVTGRNSTCTTRMGRIAYTACSYYRVIQIVEQPLTNAGRACVVTTIHSFIHSFNL